MSGESKPGKEAREKAAVVVSGLSNKDEHTAQENSEVETDHENNVIETVETNKYLETMKVFDVEAKPKSEPEEQFESIRDMAKNSVVARGAQNIFCLVSIVFPEEFVL